MAKRVKPTLVKAHTKRVRGRDGTVRIVTIPATLRRGYTRRG